MFPRSLLLPLFAVAAAVASLGTPSYAHAQDGNECETHTAWRDCDPATHSVSRIWTFDIVAPDDCDHWDVDITAISCDLNLEVPKFQVWGASGRLCFGDLTQRSSGSSFWEGDCDCLDEKPETVVITWLAPTVASGGFGLAEVEVCCADCPE